MRRLFLCLLLVVVAAPALAGDWPQWLGPRRDGASTETVLPWKQDPKKLWSQPVGEGYSVPVVAGGRVFVHARVAGKDEEEILALDAKTGKVLWRTAYARGPFQSVLNTGPQATPCVVGGRVYAFGITGRLTCLDAADGTQRWQVDVCKKLGQPLPRFGVTCSPLVVGDRVLVSVGGKGSAVVGFDADTGAVAWKALDGPISTASPIVYLNRAKKGGAALEAVFVNNRGLVALDPADGSVSWEYVVSDQPLVAAPSPVVAGDLILVSSARTGGHGIRLTAEGDKVIPAPAWKNEELTGYFSTPVAVGKDYLIVQTTTLLPQPTSKLCCVDAATGKILWSKDKVGVYQAGLIRAGDHLLVLDDSGLLRLLEHDPMGYRERARTQACGGTLVNPALANGCVFVRDGKAVTCLQLAE